MADQGNQQFGGQGAPIPGGQNPAPGAQNPPAGGQPGVPVPPVPAPMPAAPVTPVVPTPGFPGAPAAPVAPVPPVQPAPTVPQPAAVPQPVAPAPAAPATPAPAAPAAPAKPKKPMTLEDLAKQTPIFSDEELEEDEFDPWAPLDDAKSKEEEIQDEPEEEPEVIKVDESVKEEPKKEEPKEDVKPTEPAPELDASPAKEDVASEKMDVIEGDVVEADIDDPFEGIEPDEEGNPLKEFFANAHIDGKKVVGCIVAFVVIIAVIVGLIFGGKALLNMLSDDSPKEVVKEEVKEEPKKEVKEEPKEEPKEVVTEEPKEVVTELPDNWVDPTLYAGIKAGEDGALDSLPHIPVPDTSALTGGNENMVEYVGILSQIRNLYETDIADLLNRSTDRNSTLSQFIAQLKASHKAGVDAIPAIQSRKFEIQEEFDRVTADKQAQEDAYFENLTANNAVEADGNLQNFIVLARESVDLRARYRALDKVEELMIQYTSAMETRIRDVEFNREALIKGVKVIDVEGSNIDLIIPEADL